MVKKQNEKKLQELEENASEKEEEKDAASASDAV